MNPFIMVIHQGLSAAAEILYPTAQLLFITVTASFIFIQRQPFASIWKCGRTEDNPKTPNVLLSLALHSGSRLPPGQGFSYGAQYSTAQKVCSDQRHLQGQKHCRKLTFSGNVLRVWAPAPLRELKLTPEVFWESYSICHPWSLALGLFLLKTGRSLTSLRCLSPWRGSMGSLFVTHSHSCFLFVNFTRNYKTLSKSSVTGSPQRSAVTFQKRIRSHLACKRQTDNSSPCRPVVQLLQCDITYMVPLQ